ncbi:MAG: hypothetical protein LBC96_06850 [Lachnospiraceae bacterium]|nr:hypothetical protein [Lachnospiraceae bacterium]
METDNSKEYLLQVIAHYRQPLEPFFRYIPWFLERKDKNLERLYDGDDVNGTISFPVYDSTLLGFIRAMNDTGLMDRNYPYILRRKNLYSYIDELEQIENCHLQEIDVIIGIISKYVLGGMTRGRLWNEAVEYGIFYHSLARIKFLTEIFTDTAANER